MQQPGVAYVAGSPGQPTVIVQQPVGLSNAAQQIFCPTCNRPVISKTVQENGTLTWLACCLIFFLGGPFFCCLIPFCCKSCKDVKHQCPDCRNSLGIYKRI